MAHHLDAFDTSPLNIKHPIASFSVNSSMPYGMHSFSPASGTAPDENGVYAVIRFCGTFATTGDAESFVTTVINDHDDATTEPFLVTDIGHYKPLTRNRQYTGTPVQVSGENAGDVVKATDFTRGAGAIDLAGSLQASTTTVVPDARTTAGATTAITTSSADADVPQIAGANGRFFQSPDAFRVLEDKDAIEAKNRRVGTRLERQKDFTQQQQALQHLLTIEPAAEIDEFVDNMTGDLERIGEIDSRSQRRYERHIVILKILNRYKLARTRRAVALSRLAKMKTVSMKAVEAAEFAEKLVVDMHESQPDLKTRWIACYMSALKNSGLVLKDSDPYCLLRYITKREWDEQPLMWQSELMQHKQQSQTAEFQGVIQTHERLIGNAGGDEHSSDEEVSHD